MTRTRWWVYLPFASSAAASLWFGLGSWSMVSLVICLGLAVFALLADLQGQVTAVQTATVEAVLLRVLSDRDLALTRAQSAALPAAIRRATGSAASLPDRRLDEPG